ncbi:kelch-like protein 10 [Gouania willdenowi]|uniref:kelch-like protein 10 n=1 Tax=Gouania willdenowi TaxID=441366 RepID=UPI001055605A|nr:kelch-like protein 10 [Gouania willdenowi]
MMEVHQFNVKSLEQPCFEFLKDRLCPKNCIGLWQFTNACYFPILLQLKNEAFHFICENFEEVSLCEEFLQLEVQELADILGQDDLTVTQESTVYQSILRWINHMPEERQGAISVHTHPSLENPMTHLFLYSTVFLGRCFYIVCGGLSWTNPSNRVWRFNLVTHTWQEMSPMQESRRCVSVTVLKGCIYAMGGIRNLTSHRTAERYQPNINQWTFIASMNEERRDASCTTLNNKIYICGGQSNRVLNTAEYYNPDTNQWTLITPMGTHRVSV